MSSCLVIRRGASKLHRVSFTESDGTTPRPLLAFVSPGGIKVEIWQDVWTGGTPIPILRKTLTYGVDDELRAVTDDADEDEVILEYTAAITSALTVGKVREVWTLLVPDEDFDAENDIKTIIHEVTDLEVKIE